MGITIATRKSLLALKQTDIVKNLIRQLDANIAIELMPMQTTGDAFLKDSLAKIGGKGLFVKELERALISREASLAVHSMKDVPHSLPQGLEIVAMLPREDSRDAFVSKKYSSFSELPQGAVIGTSSFRRGSQLKAIRPDISIKTLRGNIHTRLDKAKNYDAIILAAAGLKRMGFAEKINTFFAPTELLPAAGQGAIGIECRSDNHDLIKLLRRLSCQNTVHCVNAERAMTRRLNGSCHVPIAAFAFIDKHGQLQMTGRVGTPDGVTLLESSDSAPVETAEELGTTLAENLIAKGAKSILDQCR